MIKLNRCNSLVLYRDGNKTNTRVHLQILQPSDKGLFWEMIKMEIRASTIIFAKNKAKQKRNEEKDLLKTQPITGKDKIKILRSNES